MLKESLRRVEPTRIRHLSLPDRVALFQEDISVFTAKLEGQDRENYETLIDLLILGYASQTREFKETYEARSDRIKELLADSNVEKTLRAIDIMPWVELLCFRPEVEEISRNSPTNTGHAKIK
ncbi:MAG: hypothetical protein Q7S79_00265 [bacterium]|nr:hypothetical protein [bacterium]